MKIRPTSITVISWFLIISAGISLVSTLAIINNSEALALMEKNSLPISFQHAITYVGLVVMIVSGVAMLKGKNWARFLYVIWSVVGLVIGIATSPMKAAMIPGFVVFLVVAFFLFRPKASAFFAPRETANNA